METDLTKLPAVENDALRMRRVIGPPGCGKTSRLADICQKAARHFGGEKVLVCSLTRAARREVVQRQIPVPRQQIGTMHSFAYRALGNPEIADTPKGLAAFNEWIVAEGHPTYRLTVDGLEVDDMATEAGSAIQTSGDRAYAEYGIARARLEAMDGLPHLTRAFAEKWDQFKKESGMLDFADLLEMAYRDVALAPGNPQVFLMDEGQDTPKLGMRLIRKWGEQAEHFFVVGDPLQNLYHWAGTDPEAFTYPVLPAAQQEVLAQSYRVPAKVHALALRWVAPLKKAIEEQMGQEILYYPRREDLGHHLPHDERWGETVDGTIRALQTATFKYPDLAVRDAERYLAAGKSVMFQTSCSYMLQPIISVLRKAGISFHNPYRETRGDWNPLSTKGTSASTRLLSFLRLDDTVWGEDTRLWNAKELWHWVELLEAKGLLKRGAKDAIREAASQSVPAAEDGSPGTGELKLADLDQWFESMDVVMAILEAFEEQRAIEWLRPRILATKRKALEFPIAIAQKYGASRLLDEPKVIVGTIHSLKGSQADVVYLFPDLSSAGMENWNRPGPDREGVRRAFYVGITRAYETLVLCQRSSPAAINWPPCADLLTRA